jgi:hypothetical protein
MAYAAMWQDGIAISARRTIRIERELDLQMALGPAWQLRFRRSHA